MADLNEEEQTEIEEGVASIAADLGFGEEQATPGEATETPPETEGEPANPDPGDEAAKPAKSKQAASGDKPVPSTSKPSPEASPATSGEAATGEEATLLAAPPKAWRKETTAFWDKIPEEARREIVKREEDIQKGFSKLNDLANFGDAFVQNLRPHLPTLQKYNLDPAKHASDLFTIHRTLVEGTPKDRVGVIRQLMRDHNISDEELGSPDFQPPYIDPQVRDLTTRYNTLQSQIQENARKAALEETQRFAADPAHPHFDAVSEDIARLINSNTCSTLQEAYDQAIWLNPTVRQQILDAKEADRKESERKAREAAAAKARRSTASNLRVTPKSKSLAPVLGSMDDTLAATAERLFGDS